MADMNRTGWPKLRIIVAIVGIVSVIFIPAYAAYNEQSKVAMTDAEVARGPVEAVVDDWVEEVEPDGQRQPDTTEPQETATPRPAATPRPTQQSNGFSVIEGVEIKKEKWVPEIPVTNQEKLRDSLVEEGTLNILILGRDRRYMLDDAVGVVNIDAEKKTIKIIMFPRDTYIEYSEDIKEASKKIRMDREPGWWKLNNAYKVGANTERVLENTYNNNKFGETGYDFMCQVIYEKFDVEIDDYVMISTTGFSRFVEIFGGVTVHVPIRMRYNDPTQGLNIDLRSGTYKLTGKQAEGFVRFRQGYTTSGQLYYYDRTKSQIAFMKAFMEQHGKLSNVTKIPEILSTLNRYVEHSLEIGDVLTKYMTLLSDVISEGYELSTYQIDFKERKIQGSSYAVVEYKSGLGDDDQPEEG